MGDFNGHDYGCGHYDTWNEALGRFAISALFLFVSARRPAMASEVVVVFSLEMYCTVSWLVACVVVVAALGSVHRHRPTSQNIQRVSASAFQNGYISKWPGELSSQHYLCCPTGVYAFRSVIKDSFQRLPS